MSKQKKWIVDEGRTFVQVPFPDGFKNENTSFDLFLSSLKDQNIRFEDIAGVKLERHYKLDAPQGVAGRNSDNTFIQEVLGWEPSTPLRDGMAETYAWISEQFAARKAGKRVVEG